MNYISAIISKIFNLETYLSLFKFNYDYRKIIILLVTLIVSYLIITPLYNLIKKLFNKKKHHQKLESETLTYRKYRSLDSSDCSGCKSKSNLTENLKSLKCSKSYLNKYEVNSVLRKFKLNE